MKLLMHKRWSYSSRNKRKPHYIKQKLQQDYKGSYSSIHLVCFVSLSVWHLLYRLHWRLDRDCFPWLMQFESKRSMNSLGWVITSQHKVHIFKSRQWIFMGGKKWLFAFHLKASLSLVVFMPIELCIEDWNPPLSSVLWLSYSYGSPVVSLK